MADKKNKEKTGPAGERDWTCKDEVELISTIVQLNSGLKARVLDYLRNKISRISENDPNMVKTSSGNDAPKG